MRLLAFRKRLLEEIKKGEDIPVESYNLSERYQN